MKVWNQEWGACETDRKYACFSVLLATLSFYDPHHVEEQLWNLILVFFCDQNFFLLYKYVRGGWDNRYFYLDVFNLFRYMIHHLFQCGAVFEDI